ncbi:hypothetical protein AiwAL_15960 [Acidiphilium sp. AL]|uniref:Transposase n=1 Tax=Acidiphilium iwatense TaxID=768198 RepID=A0ABS9DYH0_9PROT|nr:MULTISPECIES: hypothetical protein [Acidiphilium]MCF3947791.1 hypothetical protein [Acidiphilium iwatense]MCU4161577.1 hypothetical protein [Acidiphilium sp. AL]
MARTRDRRRNKLLFVSVEIRESERSALVRQRLLEPGSENDPAAVARALYHLFDWIFRDA